ncbi:MAG: YitT family protein, partial [Segetibacter sp.]|nr:YitT family protein [Segetibacter sp.]
DYVIEGIEAYTGVTIISGESELIKYRLVNGLKRGITVYKGERGFLPGKFEISNDVDIIFTVVTRLELRRLKNLVYEVDPKAFVFANTVKEASGGIVKRKLREH